MNEDETFISSGIIPVVVKTKIETHSKVPNRKYADTKCNILLKGIIT